MIISHKHKFIFLKTRKTAGTSMEIALSKFCGEDDIITLIAEKDIDHKPQNYEIKTYHRYTWQDWKRFLIKREYPTFYNHVHAKVVKQYVSPEIWSTYYKFCFERNPYDRVISIYYWRNREYKKKWQKTQNQETLSEFIQRLDKRACNAGIYTIDGEVAVDKI